MFPKCVGTQIFVACVIFVNPFVRIGIKDLRCSLEIDSTKDSCNSFETSINIYCWLLNIISLHMSNFSFCNGSKIMKQLHACIRIL